MRAHILIVVSFLWVSTGARAVELTLAPRALAEAIEIGQSRIDSDRARFHQAYRISVARPPIDDIDVVTPFRRVALAAETRARLGDRRFGQREARAILAATPGQVDVLVELTFHPLNTYIGVPAYDVRLLAAGVASKPAIVATAIERIPRFGPRLAGMSRTYPYPPGMTGMPGGQPLTGGTLLVRLEDEALTNGRYDVMVIEAGKEIARATIDFGALR